MRPQKEDIGFVLAMIELTDENLAPESSYY